MLNTSLTLYPEAKDKGKFIFNLLISLLILNALSCGAVLSYYAISGKFFPYINLLISYIFLNNASFLIEYVYLMQNKGKKLVIYTIFIHIVLLSLVFLSLHFVGDLRLVLWSLVIYTIVKCLWLLFQIAPVLNFSIDIQEIRYIGKYAIPLILSMLLSGSAEYIDGLIVKYYFSDSGFAVFRYGAKEIPFVFLIANAFSTSTLSRVSENLESSLIYIKKQSANLMHLLFPISVVLLFASDYLFEFVFDVHFVQSASIFRIYILLVIFRLVFPQTILTGQKKNMALLMISFTEIFLNVTLSLIFVNFWGLRGIAFATLIAFAIDKLLSASYNYFKLGILPGKYIPFKIYIPYSLILLLAFYLAVRFV